VRRNDLVIDRASSAVEEGCLRRFGVFVGLNMMSNNYDIEADFDDR
jgi:hypothetical protein